MAPTNVTDRDRALYDSLRGDKPCLHQEGLNPKIDCSAYAVNCIRCQLEVLAKAREEGREEGVLTAEKRVETLRTLINHFCAIFGVTEQTWPENQAAMDAKAAQLQALEQENQKLRAAWADAGLTLPTTAADWAALTPPANVTLFVGDVAPQGFREEKRGACPYCKGAFRLGFLWRKGAHVASGPLSIIHAEPCCQRVRDGRILMYDFEAAPGPRCECGQIEHEPSCPCWTAPTEARAPEVLTDAQIITLRDEAAWRATGNPDATGAATLAAVCNRALAGDSAALAEVGRVLAATRTAADGVAAAERRSGGWNANPPQGEQPFPAVGVRPAPGAELRSYEFTACARQRSLQALRNEERHLRYLAAEARQREQPNAADAWSQIADEVVALIAALAD